MAINTSTIGDIDSSEVETADGSLNTSEIGEVIDHTNSELQFIGVIGIDGITNTPARIVYNATQDRYQLRKNGTEKSEVGVSAVVFYEPRANGVERITLQAPTSVVADYTLTLPDTLPTENSTLRFDSSGNAEWQTAITTGSPLAQDGKYHVICSDPTTNLLVEAEDLGFEEIHVGNNAALPTPRAFTADPAYGTEWVIDASTVKVKLADVPLTTFKETLGDAYHVLQRDVAGEVVSNSVKAIVLPSGGNAERPGTPSAGMLRYNTDLGNFEQYITSWGPVGVSPSGGVLVVDTVATFEALTTLSVGQLVYVVQNDAFYEIHTSAITRDGTFILDTGTAGNQGQAVSGKFIYGNFKVSGTLSVDTISENTSAAGVTIDSVLVKDGTVGLPNSTFKTTVQANTLSGNNTLTLPVETATLATRSDKLSVFAATSSAELAGVISDETGSGALVFANSPTFVTKITTPEVDVTNGAQKAVIQAPTLAGDTALTLPSVSGTFALLNAQVVTVAKSGAMFTTIQGAIDSIIDATITKPYSVRVAPGVYTENVTLKDHVYVENGISGSVTIVGKIIATGLTGNSGIKGFTVQHTPTGDNEFALEHSGTGFYLIDCDIFTVGAADYITTGVSLSCSVGASVFNSTVYDRRSGNITKAYKAWEFAGAGVFGVFNASASARAAYTAGTNCLFSITGSGSFTMSGGAGIWASSAAFSGAIRGLCCTATSSANPRIVTGTQIRLTGTSGGTATASHLDSGGNSGRIDLTGCEFFVSGFTTENVTDTDTGDSQRVYLSTTNKTLAKTGAGLASVTPLDLVQSGFVRWAGTGAYFTYVAATGVFTLSRACIGMEKGSQVYIASGQTVTCTNFANNFIYGDSNGVLRVTTDPSFEDKIILFSLYSDGTNYTTTKQTHPVSYPAATSEWAHNALGSSLKNDANGVVTLLSGAGRTIKLVGDSTYYDHGLNTTVADSAGNAISMLMMYTGASGATFQGAAFTAIPGVRQNGTSLSNTSNGKFVNYRIGVYASSNADDTTANTIAQYIIVPDSTEHNNASAAAAQVTANTVAAFPSVATGGLEVINIGFATIQGNGAGGGTLTVVTSRKQVFGVNFASGSTSSAGTVTTDISLFDNLLSASDTSVQLALNTIDENAVKAGTGTFEADCLARYANTTGKLLANPATTPVKQSSTGVLTVQNTTASTDKDTGALIVQGGVGVEEDVYAGGQVVAPTVSGTTSVTTPKLAPISANTVIDIDTTAGINLPSGTTAQRPGTAALGDFRFNTTELKLEVCTAAGTPGEWSAAGSGGTVIKVAQAGIGTGTFVGQALYLAGSTWTLANHTTAVTAEVVGLISKITDSGNIELTLGGEVTGIAFADVFQTTPADGDVVWLGTTTGKLTTTAPTTVGYILKPQGVVRSKGASTCSVMYANMRGDTVGGANLYSTIGLANNATTTFYTISCAAGEGGWISGTIKIDGTTDYAIPFFCFFSRQLDGTTYNVSPFYGSSTPATGFAISNSGSAVQITLPDVGSPGTCSVTYCVQAAASGTTLPVSISPSSINGAADISCTSGYGISFGNETLKNYDESLTQTFTITFAGGATKTATGNFCRVGRVVTATFKDLVTTSATATGVFSGAGVPSGFRPVNQVVCCAVAYDNGTAQAGAGAFIIATDGTVTGTKTLQNTGFAGGAGGGTGLDSTTYSWICAV
jgi:hypothetical protein